MCALQDKVFAFSYYLYVWLHSAFLWDNNVFTAVNKLSSRTALKFCQWGLCGAACSGSVLYFHGIAVFFCAILRLALAVGVALPASRCLALQPQALNSCCKHTVPWRADRCLMGLPLQGQGGQEQGRNKLAQGMGSASLSQNSTPFTESKQSGTIGRGVAVMEKCGSSYLQAVA